MERIEINNIGPIKHVNFTLNKVNLIIGPQSSGKSTIAKIVSFCQWLEKYVIIHQSADSVNSDFIRNQFVTFHGFSNYLYEDSYLHFVGEFIDFEFFSSDSFSLNVSENISNGLNSKVAYIPSERNILSLPNIASLQLGNTYVRNFIFDWLTIRGNYNGNSRLPILDLGIDYYYDKNKGDVIAIDSNRELSLTESSSGLQALVPMLVYINYVTKWIYSNEAELSFDKYSSLQKTLQESLSKLKSESNTDNLADIHSLMEKIGKPHSTKLTIEEGEMNIFPSTQYNFVKALVRTMDFDRGDTLLLTTHSPYIMTSINNLIQASNALKEGELSKDVVAKVIPEDCWLDYNIVSAWSVNDGKIVSINDDDYRMISSDALDLASEEISNDFSKLL